MHKSTVLYCERCLSAQWKCMVLVHKNRPIRKVGWNTNFWKSISNNSMELYHSKYIHFLHKDPYFAMSYNSGRVTGNTFCRPISHCVFCLFAFRWQCSFSSRPRPSDRKLRSSWSSWCDPCSGVQQGRVDVHLGLVTTWWIHQGWRKGCPPGIQDGPTPYSLLYAVQVFLFPVSKLL